jgi:hypothetical protein
VSACLESPLILSQIIHFLSSFCPPVVLLTNLLSQKMPLSSLSVLAALELLRRDSFLTSSFTTTTTIWSSGSPISTWQIPTATTIATDSQTISATTSSSTVQSILSASLLVTATTSISSPTSTPTTPQNQTAPFQISSGGVAGIGIGTAVIGGLLAALIFWVCMRRYKYLGEERRRHTRNDGEKRAGSRSDAPLEENLLERADDSQIRKSMQDLNELIDQHCENHYHDQAVDIAQGSLERALIEAGYDSLSSSAPSVAEFARLLHSPGARLLAIRQFIALVILSHVGWWSRAEVSLLPPQIAAFCQTIPPTERQPGSEEG